MNSTGTGSVVIRSKFAGFAEILRRNALEISHIIVDFGYLKVHLYCTYMPSNLFEHPICFCCSRTLSIYAPLRITEQSHPVRIYPEILQYARYSIRSCEIQQTPGAMNQNSKSVHSNDNPYDYDR